MSGFLRMVPDYGWPNPHLKPSEKDYVVVTDESSSYCGRVGRLVLDEDRRKTVLVQFGGCLTVGFHRRDVRGLTTRDEILVTNLGER